MLKSEIILKLIICDVELCKHLELENLSTNAAYSYFPKSAYMM